MLSIILGIIVLYCAATVALDIYQIRLLKKQRRAAVFENAKARLDRARAQSLVITGGGTHYFDSPEEAADFYDWVMTPEIEEMSDREMEY